MDKSHIACFLGGAALATGAYWLAQRNNKKSKLVNIKAVDT
jgi:hypothetical protein